MRLLLLGCSGFIGSQLVPMLIRSGHHVTVISRKLKEELDFEVTKRDFEHLQLNPASKENWQNEKLIAALEKSEAVINLAGEPIAEKRWTKSHCKLIKDSRLQSTRNLINTLNNLRSTPKVLINGSAIGFYGTSEKKVFNEESKPGEDFLADLCKEWEDLAMQKPKSTRLVILRIGIVLEKQGGALSKMLPVFKSGFGGALGTGRQWISWIHLYDLCAIIQQAIKEERYCGVINCVAPEACSMNEFSKILSITLQKPALLPVPGIILKLLIGDGAKIVLEGQRVMPKKLERLGFKFTYPKLCAALKKILS